MGPTHQVSDHVDARCSGLVCKPRKVPHAFRGFFYFGAVLTLNGASIRGGAADNDKASPA